MSVTSSEYRAASEASATARSKRDMLAHVLAQNVADGVESRPETVEEYRQARDEYEAAFQRRVALLAQYTGGARG